MMETLLPSDQFGLERSIRKRQLYYLFTYLDCFFH